MITTAGELSKCVCDNGKKLSDYVLANLPAVRKHFRLNIHLPFRDIIKNVPTICGVDKRHMPEHNSISGVTNSNYRETLQQLYFVTTFQSRRQYEQLPQYLLHFSQLNPDASVALQADQSTDQFLRLFVGFPIAAHHGILTMPILVIDAFHFQSKHYDGRAIIFASKCGFGKTISLAFALSLIHI